MALTRNPTIRLIKLAKGFTLIEVLVAVLVMTLIFTLIWQAFGKSVEIKDYVEAGNEMYHKMRWTMDKMSLDLTTAYVSTGKNNLSQFVGVSGQGREGIPQDELHFTSFSHIRYTKDEKSSDQCELSYFIELDPSTDTYTLFRREDYTLDDELDQGGEVNELIEGILAFNLKYYDGEDWVDDWDSRNYENIEESVVEVNVDQSDLMVDNIPAAVEIILSMQDLEGDEIYMTTKVKLMLSAIDLSDDAEEEDGDSDKDEESSSGSSSTSPSSGGSSSSGTSSTKQ